LTPQRKSLHWLQNILKQARVTTNGNLLLSTISSGLPP